MSFVSLATAASLTGLSRRTLWRRIGDGSLRTLRGGTPGEKTRLRLDDVLALADIAPGAEDHEVILAADRGEAEGMCDLALLLLAADRAEEAVAWLRRAADKFYPEAMHWLGRCHLAGLGVAADAALGRHWLARAADHGHVGARHLLGVLNEAAADEAEAPAQREAALDAAERALVMRVLEETAERAEG